MGFQDWTGADAKEPNKTRGIAEVSTTYGTSTAPSGTNITDYWQIGSSAKNMIWTFLGGGITDGSFSFWSRAFGALSASGVNNFIIEFREGANIQASVTLTSTGLVELKDSTATVRDTSTLQWPNGTAATDWDYITVALKCNATTGSMSFRRNGATIEASYSNEDTVAATNVFFDNVRIQGDSANFHFASFIASSFGDGIYPDTEADLGVHWVKYRPADGNGDLQNQTSGDFTDVDETPDNQADFVGFNSASLTWLNTYEDVPVGTEVYGVKAVNHVQRSGTDAGVNGRVIHRQGVTDASEASQAAPADDEVEQIIAADALGANLRDGARTTTNSLQAGYETLT